MTRASSGRLEVLAGGVVDGPVLVPLAGEERAGLATAHGDDHVGGLDELAVELRRGVVGDGQAALGEDLGDDGIHAAAGLGAGRADLDAVGCYDCGALAATTSSEDPALLFDFALTVLGWATPGDVSAPVV